MKKIDVRVGIVGVLVIMTCVLTGMPTWEEWQTNTDFPLIGDPNAVKGGEFHYAIRSYPCF